MSTSELRRQRDKLNAEIARREAQEAGDYNDQLDQLADAVRRFADRHGSWTESRRKNVTSVTVNDLVTVEFGAIESEYRGHLSVRDLSGLRCTFENGLPTEAGLLGLIAGQLGAERTPEETP